MAYSEDPRSSMTYLGHLRGVALAGVRLIQEKTRTYGPSWKRRLGAGAWFTAVRPWDRLETIVERHGGDIFAAIEEHPLGGDGTALDAIRDVRNYLLLIEAEMVARGVISAPAEETREAALEEVRSLLKRLFGPGAPEGLSHTTDPATRIATLSLTFRQPSHSSTHHMQEACRGAVMQVVGMPEEQTERVTNAAHYPDADED